ncbi:hypothetical protein FIBSPDRAFT_760126, partial [Athelia psychrophila]
FSKLRKEQAKNGENLWGPFGSQEKWELAQWLLQNVGNNATDKFLKLSIISSGSPICGNYYELTMADLEQDRPFLQK